MGKKERKKSLKFCGLTVEGRGGLWEKWTQMTHWGPDFQQGVVQSCWHHEVRSPQTWADSVPLSSGQPRTFSPAVNLETAGQTHQRVGSALGGRCNSMDFAATGSLGSVLLCMDVKIPILLFVTKWLCPDHSDVSLPALTSMLCACSQPRHCPALQQCLHFCTA